jgi:hypothetical protein
LSHFEKLKNNFKFSDFNQMPDRRLWRKFSVEEKEAFLKLRNEFSIYKEKFNPEEKTKNLIKYSLIF